MMLTGNGINTVTVNGKVNHGSLAAANRGVAEYELSE